MTKKHLKRALVAAAEMLTDTKIDLLEAQMQIEELQKQIRNAKRDLSWAEYRSARYRNTIERVTGGKFVWGYDPTDASMLESDPSTHGWYFTPKQEVGA